MYICIHTHHKQFMKPLNLPAAFLIFGIIQGLLLVVAINKLPKRNKAANRLLSAFILLVTFTLFWRVSNVKGLLQLVMGIIQDVILFLYGPVFYLYARTLLTTSLPTFRQWRKHLAPAFIYLLLTPPMVLWYVQKFWWFLYGASAFGSIIHSSIYMFTSYRLVRNFRKKSSTPHLHTRYLQTIIILICVCLLASLYSTFIIILDLPYHLRFFNYNLAWIVVSFITFTLGYYAMFSPEIFRLPAEEIAPLPLLPVAKAPAKKLISNTDLEVWKPQLTTIMETKQPYLNPKLTLADLAELMQMDKVLVSKVIHEGFDSNFYDYVNTYRIGHFVKLSQNEAYQHYTHLALAYEVGFNAKSTFHRTFKKLKNTTPRGYLKSLAIKQE